MKCRRIHNYLKYFRKLRGYTQKDIAILLELKSPSIISRWEHGVYLPETLNALKMAVLFETSVDAIFEDHRQVLIEEFTNAQLRLQQHKGGQ